MDGSNGNPTHRASVPSTDVDKAQRSIETAIHGFVDALELISQGIKSGSIGHQELELMTERAMSDMWDAADKFEGEVGGNASLIQKAQHLLRSATDRYFTQSVYQRARVWPRGYQGDYEMLEFHYGNTPVSHGIGRYIETYLLQSALAIAVRERRELLKNILRKEMAARTQPKVMDIACGPCREIVELKDEISSAEAFFTCVDHDEEALSYSRDRLDRISFPMGQIQFRQYNALKMVNHDRNIKEFGAQDIIYSVGLFDYLNDDVLVRLLKALYELLNPGGVLVVSFKDSEKYSTFIYHWIVYWNAFLQRTESDIRTLYEKAGFARDQVSTVRTASKIIVFYNVAK